MRETEQALRFLTDEVRTLHEAVVLDPVDSPAPSWPASSWRRPDCCSAATAAASSSSAKTDRCAASPASACPTGEGVDDLVAQTIGDKAAWSGRCRRRRRRRPSRAGVVLLAVPLVIRGEVVRRDGLHLREPAARSTTTASASRARSPTRPHWRSRTRGSGRASRRRRSRRSARASPATCTTR